MIWHLRILPVDSDTLKFKVLVILTNKIVEAESRIQELVNHELLKVDSFPTMQLHLQRNTSPELVPLFVVEIPLMGWQFILDSRKGVTQWYIEAISEASKQDTPMIHGFFCKKLVAFSWGVNNLLVTLQRAYLCLPLQNPTAPAYMSKHYIVNILLRIKGPPHGPDTKFTTHFVSADTKIVDLFDILAGGALDEGYTLVQWVWCKEEGRYDVFKCCRYSEVRTQNMTFKDVGWVGGKEVWLLPTCQ